MKRSILKRIFQFPLIIISIASIGFGVYCFIRSGNLPEAWGYVVLVYFYLPVTIFAIVIHFILSCFLKEKVLLQIGIEGILAIIFFIFLFKIIH